MARCVSSHTNLPKKRYTSRKAAKTALQGFAQRHGVDVADFAIYRCDECGWIHFGRDDKKKFGPPLRELPTEHMAFLYTKGVRLQELAELYRVRDTAVLYGHLKPVVEQMGGVMR